MTQVSRFDSIIFELFSELVGCGVMADTKGVESKIPREILYELRIVFEYWTRRYWAVIAAIFTVASAVVGGLAYSYFERETEILVKKHVNEKFEGSNFVSDVILQRFTQVQSQIDIEVKRTAKKQAELTGLFDKLKETNKELAKQKEEASEKLIQLQNLLKDANSQIDLIKSTTGQMQIEKKVAEIVAGITVDETFKNLLRKLKGAIVAVTSDVCPPPLKPFDRGRGRFILGAGVSTSDIPDQRLDQEGGSTIVDLSALDHRHLVLYGQEKGAGGGNAGYYSKIGKKPENGRTTTEGWVDKDGDANWAEVRVTPPYIALTWCKIEAIN